MSLNFPIFQGRTIITLDQFLINPTGKGSSFMAKRKEIKKNLEERYQKILKDNNGKFDYKVYIDKKSYFFWFKIPSETFKELNYDVVLEFVCHDKKFEKFQTINDYSINFYSNSPHMTFTYTYVLNKENLLVDLLKATKYSKRALRERPRVTNPIEIFGFEKSCYYACKYINEKKLYTKSEIEKNATEITSTTRLELLNGIISQESKFLQYETLKKRYSDAKKKEKAAKVNKHNAEVAHSYQTYRNNKKSQFKSVFTKKKK